MRKTPFINGEYYHIYNRGVDKRDVFQEDYDMQRFLDSMNEFNVSEPIGSIYAKQFNKSKLSASSTKLEKPIVEFIAYCLNNNHYHFIIRQLVDNGIEKFMQKLGAGYTRYFNEKYDRTGALFQGKFKSVHVNSNQYLLHLSSYVNLNNQVHRLSASSTKSSWGEYIGEVEYGMCEKDIIFEQFDSKKDYEKYTIDSISKLIEERDYDKNIKNLFIE